MRKTVIYWAALLWISGVFVAAQTSTNSPINISGPFPVGTEAIWLVLVAPATATITWLFGKIPPLPKWLLPWITPFAGIAIGWLIKYATNAHWPWWNSAGAGAIAVTLYEAAKGLTGAGPQSALTPTPEKQNTTPPDAP